MRYFAAIATFVFAITTYAYSLSPEPDFATQQERAHSHLTGLHKNMLTAWNDPTLIVVDTKTGKTCDYRILKARGYALAIGRLLYEEQLCKVNLYGLVIPSSTAYPSGTFGILVNSPESRPSIIRAWVDALVLSRYTRQAFSTPKSIMAFEESTRAFRKLMHFTADFVTMSLRLENFRAEKTLDELFLQTQKLSPVYSTLTSDTIRISLGKDFHKHVKQAYERIYPTLGTPLPAGVRKKIFSYLRDYPPTRNFPKESDRKKALELARAAAKLDRTNMALCSRGFIGPNSYVPWGKSSAIDYLLTGKMPPWVTTASISVSNYELVCSLSDFIRADKHIRTLVITHFSMAYEAVPKIAEALKENKTLKYLSFFRDKMTESDIQAIYDVLSEHNTTLITLRITSSLKGSCLQTAAEIQTILAPLADKKGRNLQILWK